MKLRTALSIFRRNRTNSSYWMALVPLLKRDQGDSHPDVHLLRRRLDGAKSMRAKHKAVARVAASNIRHKDGPKIFVHDEALDRMNASGIGDALIASVRAMRHLKSGIITVPSIKN